MKNDIHSLKQMLQVYKFKKKVAERRFAEQKKVVEKSAIELADIGASLMTLESGLASNSAHMRESSVCSDAVKMVHALKYKSQIEYDIARESYFLGLAQHDFLTHNAELDSRRSAIQRITVKIDAVANMEKRCNQARLNLAELSQEEDFEQTFTTRAARNG